MSMLRNKRFCKDITKGHYRRSSASFTSIAASTEKVAFTMNYDSSKPWFCSGTNHTLLSHIVSIILHDKIKGFNFEYPLHKQPTQECPLLLYQYVQLSNYIALQPVKLSLPKDA